MRSSSFFSALFLHFYGKLFLTTPYHHILSRFPLTSYIFPPFYRRLPGQRFSPSSHLFLSPSSPFFSPFASNSDLKRIVQFVWVHRCQVFLLNLSLRHCFRSLFSFAFLVTCTRLYKSLCRSIGRLVLSPSASFFSLFEHFKGPTW